MFSRLSPPARFASLRARRSSTREPPILAVMAGSLSLRVLVCAVGIAFAVGARAASPRERRFFSARHGVGVEVPPGWTLSQHTGYPSILVLLLHPNGSRISISAAPTTAKDARGLVEQNQRGL